MYLPLPPHILVTGGAGFIGSHLVEKLLDQNHRVTAIDNFDPFYDRNIKESNLQKAKEHPLFQFIEMDICQEDSLNNLLKDDYFAIIHLAAKAGVRPSIINPKAYQQTNVYGTQNLLEFARRKNIQQFVFASSSSVYGVNPHVPWSEKDGQLFPISPYASTKISGELLGHVYSHLYDIRFIALRFFTVYGPRQRPDLAIHSFTKKMMNGEPIPFYGDGHTRRDYTYVADIVDGIVQALRYDQTRYEIINLGNHQTVSLAHLVQTMEEVLGKKAVINRLPEQPGDVPITFAEIEKAGRLLNYHPATKLEEGLSAFRDWFLQQI
jgi:UDP-glucuronate 4-epimerase